MTEVAPVYVGNNLIFCFTSIGKLVCPSGVSSVFDDG